MLTRAASDPTTTHTRAYAQVTVANALAAAPNFGVDWETFWNADEALVCYRHRVSDVVVHNRQDAVTEENRQVGMSYGNGWQCHFIGWTQKSKGLPPVLCPQHT